MITLTDIRRASDIPKRLTIVKGRLIDMTTGREPLFDIPEGPVNVVPHSQLVQLFRLAEIASKLGA